jgi:hypothetical protein
VDYNNGKQQITFRTFSIDLFHTASLNQSDINRGESVMAVPEPSSLVLSLIALGWLSASSTARSRTRLAQATRSASKVKAGAGP